MNRVSKSRIGYSLIVLLLCLIVANCNRIIEQRKQYYYNKGMQLFNNRDYINAAKEFDKALILDERYFDAQYMCGMSNYFIGDYSAALPYFEKASESLQENIAVKLKLAECYINTINTRGKGRYIRLKAYFNEVIIPLGHKNRDARIILLRYYLAEKKLPEADKIIDGFLRDGEKSADFYTALAQLNLKRNKISEAAAIAIKHCTYTPYWMQTMKLIIERLESSKNYAGLEQIYKKMIEQVPSKLPYQQDLANIYRKQGNTEMENMLFQEMLKSYPDNVQVKSDYVNFLIRYNKKGEAESFLNEEINKQPENMQLKKMLIDLFVQSGQMKKAYQQTEEMLRALPKDTSNYIEFQNILTELYFKSGEFGKAKINAEEILSKYPRDRDARFLLCKIYIQEGRALPAIGELRQLTNENPSIAEFNYNLGLAHEMRGENALAEKAFRSALDCSADYKDALKKWIAIYPKTGSLSEVEIRIKKYLDIHPEDTEIKILQQSIQGQKTGILTSSKISEK